MQTAATGSNINGFGTATVVQADFSLSAVLIKTEVLVSSMGFCSLHVDHANTALIDKYKNTATVNGTRT